MRFRRGLEGCESGLIGTPGERVYGELYRGFESPPFRHFVYTQIPDIIYFDRARRGGSGALYPQAAIAGSNARLRLLFVGPA